MCKSLDFERYFHLDGEVACFYINIYKYNFLDLKFRPFPFKAKADNLNVYKVDDRGLNIYHNWKCWKTKHNVQNVIKWIEIWDIKTHTLSECTRALKRQKE